ncbi:hemolysin family protein [Rufibacter sp. LB8]|uniref:hemolysin family protein n=1 Tax=Rufibacter sp. LB8 TaxID=2777781 RepID=UPI00178C70B0|nr:hemolysin family protein [Rufibacter sp. LB8]
MELSAYYILLAVGAVLLALFTLGEVALRQVARELVKLEVLDNQGFDSFLVKREKSTLLTAHLGTVLGLLLLAMGAFGLLYQVLHSQLQLIGLAAMLLAGLSAILITWLVQLSVGLLAAFVAPAGLLRLVAAPLAFFVVVFYPLTYLVTSVFGLISENEPENELQPAMNALTLQPFAVKVQSPEEAELSFVPSNEVDSKIFNNALEFRNVKVRECMVPRTEIDAIELEEGVDVLRQAFIDTGHSKILIYQDSIDHILGYCHQFALFSSPTSLQDILTPMEAVPENMLARELFVKFITEHRSIVLVLDEFGGTSGIVTLEDVMEEILGDINDEYDEEDLLEQALPEPGTYLFSARQEIDYLNEKYQLNLPEGDYETLGGFILSVLEEIPATGDVVAVPPFEIRILSMDEHRINTVFLGLRQSASEE